MDHGDHYLHKLFHDITELSCHAIREHAWANVHYTSVCLASQKATNLSPNNIHVAYMVWTRRPQNPPKQKFGMIEREDEMMHISDID